MNKDILNELVVVKRSGQRVNFNELKIAVAIKLAFDNTPNNYQEKDINKVYEDTINTIIKAYQERKTINVEDIQDLIEQTLQKDNYKDVYQIFSSYRIRRAESRKAFSEKQQHKFVKAIEKIGEIKEEKEYINQTLNKFGETICAEYAKSYVLDNKYVRAHDEGKNYIHSISYFNLGILNETNLLITNYLNEHCLNNLIVLLININKEVNGEISITDFDIILNNYAINELKHILKEYLDQSFNLLGISEYLNPKKVEDTINKINQFTFNADEYLNFGNSEVVKRAVNLAYQNAKKIILNSLKQNMFYLFEELENSNGNYSFSFGNSNEEMIKGILMDAIDSVPNLKHVNFIYLLTANKSDQELSSIASLILKKRPVLINTRTTNYCSNGLNLGFNNGTSNIAKVSLNLARLGLKYHEINNKFYQELDEEIDLAKNELITIFETIGDKYKDNYQYLFQNNILDDDKLELGQKIRKVIKNGTLDINLIGLKECGMAISNSNYLDNILDIVKHISVKINEYCQDSKYLFTLSALNYLGASNSMLDLDKTIFGLIPKITKKDLYDNLGVINYNDLPNIININKYLTGGLLINLEFKKNMSTNDLQELLQNLYLQDVGIMKFSFPGDVC
jgi:transcriptional regulator NrdR family protein